MFDQSSADPALSQLSAAALSANDAPYGLPVEQISTNLTVPGQDLTTVAFDALSDHVLTGRTRVNFALKNQGSQDVGRFKADIVYSKDSRIGNGDDIVVGSYSFNRLAAGDTLTRTVNLRLPVDELNASAIREDRPNRGRNYRSRAQDFLGLVVDSENQVSESDERNNTNQKEGLGKDDISYFPWDINDDGVVSASESRFVRNQLGRSGSRADKRADFDGDGTITPTDVRAIAERVGYRINPKITEPDIIAQQPRQNGVLEPVIEGVVAEVGEVKKVQARFLNAPGQRFVNITRDIGKAGDFSLNQNRLKAIYGGNFPGSRAQRLVVETLNNRNQVTSSKTIRYSPDASSVERPSRDPGETTARAFNIGQLNRRRTFAESVSDSDRFDYYKFQLRTVSNVSFDLEVFDKTYDTALKIVDASGNTVFDPAETTNFVDESGDTLLDAGTYYALVNEEDFNGSTGYRLTLDADAIANNVPRVDPGETPARAFNLGKLGATQVLNGAVNDSDRLDYYKFELDRVSNVSFDLDVINERYDVGLKIVDAAGNAVFDPTETTNFVDEVGNTLLEAGTYYAQVLEEDFNDGTQYTLSLGATPVVGNTPSTDPGETPPRAFDLGLLGATQTLNAFVSDSDPIDYYKFELDDVSNVRIDLDVVNERYDVDVKIVDAAGNAVFDPTETTNFVDEVGTTLLEAGVYYALVREEDFNDGTAYELKLGATTIRNNTPSTDAGNTIADAFNLGTLPNGTQRLRAQVSDSDPFDYYQFRLNGSRNVRVDLDVINERYDVDVKILDASGAIAFDPRETTNFVDEFGTTRLSGGTYYAWVREEDFNDGSAYELKLGIS